MTYLLVLVTKPPIGTLSVGVSAEVLTTHLEAQCFPVWFVCKKNDVFITAHPVLHSTELSFVFCLTARCPESTRCSQSLSLVLFTLSGSRQMPHIAQWNGVPCDPDTGLQGSPHILSKPTLGGSQLAIQKPIPNLRWLSTKNVFTKDFRKKWQIQEKKLEIHFHVIMLLDHNLKQHRAW